MSSINDRIRSLEPAATRGSNYHVALTPDEQLTTQHQTYASKFTRFLFFAIQHSYRIKIAKAVSKLNDEARTSDQLTRESAETLKKIYYRIMRSLELVHESIRPDVIIPPMDLSLEPVETIYKAVSQEIKKHGKFPKSMLGDISKEKLYALLDTAESGLFPPIFAYQRYTEWEFDLKKKVKLLVYLRTLLLATSAMMKVDTYSVDLALREFRKKIENTPRSWIKPIRETLEELAMQCSGLEKEYYRSCEELFIGSSSE